MACGVGVAAGGLALYAKQARALPLREVVELRRRIAQAQFGIEWQCPHPRAGAASELAQAVDRVVVVGRQHQAAAQVERVALGHQLHRGAGVGGEADLVLVGIGVEEVEDSATRRLEHGGRGARGVVLRVRIAEQRAVQDLALCRDLRGTVERTAGVVEIGDALLVESRELARPEFGEERLSQHPRRKPLRRFVPPRPPTIGVPPK